MSNFSISVDLKKLGGVGVKLPDGRSAIAIPVDKNSLYVNDRAAYLSLIMRESPNDKFGNTHSLKLSVSGDKYKAMSEDERKSIPFCGSAKLVELRHSNPSSDGYTSVQPSGEFSF